MAITEFARLYILRPHSATKAPVYNILRSAVPLITEASGGARFRLYRNLDDERDLYLFGHWDSLASHQAFIDGEVNKALLRGLQGMLEVVDFTHFEVEFASLELGERVWIGRRRRDVDGMEGWFRGLPELDPEDRVIWCAEKGDVEASWVRVEDFESVLEDMEDKEVKDVKKAKEVEEAKDVKGVEEVEGVEGVKDEQKKPEEKTKAGAK